MYVNLRGISGKNAELPNIPNINITHKQVLSLPFLHEMNIKTLNHIKELRSQAITNPILITVVAIIIIYLIIKATVGWKKRLILNKLKAALEKDLEKTEDGLHLGEGIVNGC